MVINVDSDDDYLVAPGVKRRISGFFYFKHAPDGTFLPQLNNPIHVKCKYLRHVVASASEAEVGRIFHNCQENIPLRNTLIKTIHPQPPTPINIDNTKAKDVTYNTMALKNLEHGT